jgi:hypothetical protein
MKETPPSPRLRIVSLDQVRLHEDYDARRVRELKVRLRRNNVLKNPVITVECDDCYIVLDGATRTQALLEMDIPHIIVQVVSYDDPGIQLESWYHAINEPDPTCLLNKIGAIHGMRSRPAELKDLKPSLNGRRHMLGFLTKDGRAVCFQSTLGFKERCLQLNQIVQLYRDKAHVHRTTEVDLPALLPRYPDLSALILFPPFKPADVIHSAMNNVKFPMGITRHLIPGRALGLNVPLTILEQDTGLEEKNVWLERMILDRIQKNSVRQYEETTFIFDDGL